MSKTEGTQELAAAKSGMDVKTARKYLDEGTLPSENQPERTWRTRLDPFERVWEEIREHGEIGKSGAPPTFPYLSINQSYHITYRRFPPANPDLAAFFFPRNPGPPSLSGKVVSSRVS